MKRWWIRSAVRIGAALILPVIVPAIITLMIWALPGDPASIICPPETCGGTEQLAKRWHLDGSPMDFYFSWMGKALQGDFGNSWRAHQGVPITELFAESIPTTLALIGMAWLFVSIGVVGAATRWIPAIVDPFLYAIGVIPALVLALLAAAAVEIGMGSEAFMDSGRWARLLAGAAVLGFADNAFSGAVSGTRELFHRENQQRYVGVALLRGESRISNTLPNVTPALAGQLRARTLHLLSGAVVVEVVTRIDGLGDLLWAGTLKQDFGLVLAAATCFAVVSALLLFLQAIVEIAVNVHIRRAPAVAVEAV